MKIRHSKYSYSLRCQNQALTIKKLSRWIMKTRQSKYSFSASIRSDVKNKP